MCVCMLSFDSICCYFLSICLFRWLFANLIIAKWKRRRITKRGKKKKKKNSSNTNSIFKWFTRFAQLNELPIWNRCEKRTENNVVRIILCSSHYIPYIYMRHTQNHRENVPFKLRISFYYVQLILSLFLSLSLSHRRFGNIQMSKDLVDLQFIPWNIMKEWTSVRLQIYILEGQL